MNRLNPNPLAYALGLMPEVSVVSGSPATDGLGLCGLAGVRQTDHAKGLSMDSTIGTEQRDTKSEVEIGGYAAFLSQNLGYTRRDELIDPSGS